MPVESVRGRHSPVIIAGMHRSGTSMITRMLERLGLFVGKDVERNSESVFFMRSNKWLLRQSAASWCEPGPMKWLRSNPEALRMCEEYIGSRLNSLSIRSYLGMPRFLRGERPLPGLAAPWGWKDPRNTFTLPVWMALFPDARIVHVFRNGVDVAASLRARNERRFGVATRQHRERMRLGLYRWIRKRGGFVPSVRCLDLAGAFSLWQEYVEESFRLLESTRARMLAVKYEDVLQRPEEELGKLAEFCGLATGGEPIRAAAGLADASGAKRYSSSPELLAFHGRVEGNEWMQRLGY